jgi:ATP/maltotriose-dependent transcriptional regulator MalT
MGELAKIAKRYEEAQHFLQESVARFRALGDRWASGWPIGTLGIVAQELNNYEEAQQYYSANLALNKEVGDRMGIVFLLTKWGTMSFEMGEIETSRRLIIEALKLLPDVGWHPLTVAALNWVAHHLKAAEGRAEQVVELLSLLHKHCGLPQHSLLVLYQIDRRDILHQIDTLKAELPPEVFAAAVRRGEARNLEAAVAALLEQFSGQDEQHTADGANHTRLPDQPMMDPLSEREREILQLIAEGLSSREVAERIVLSVGTIRWYLKQIYSKLDAHSRAQAIARARELKLLA